MTIKNDFRGSVVISENTPRAYNLANLRFNNRTTTKFCQINNNS